MNKDEHSFRLMKKDGTVSQWNPPKVTMLGFDSGVMVLRSLMNMLPGGQSGLGQLQQSLLPMMACGMIGDGDMDSMLPMMLMTMTGAGGISASADGSAPNPMNMMMPMMMAGMMKKMMGGSTSSDNKQSPIIGAVTGKPSWFDR